MKVTVLSDIHANFKALKQIEHDILTSDYVICLGDYIGYGYEVNEVIDYLKKIKNVVCVLGNHDSYLINGTPPEANNVVRKGIDYAQACISEDNFNWLKQLDVQKELLIDGEKFLVQHASPEDPLKKYLYPDNQSIKKYFNLGYNYILFGHTHHAFLLQENNKYILNPGSIGQPRDKRDMLSYIVISEQGVEIKREKIISTV